MTVKFSGHFNQFRNKDTVRISVPPKVFANTLNYADIKNYVVPVGTVWEIERVDFPHKKIRGRCFANIAGFEPFPVTHDFNFAYFSPMRTQFRLTRPPLCFVPCSIISLPITTRATKLSTPFCQLTLNTLLNSKALRHGLTVKKIDN